MKKKLTLTVLLLLLTGCAAEAVKPAPPSPTNELQGKPLDNTTTTVDLSFLNTTTTQPKPAPTTTTPPPMPSAALTVTDSEPTAQQWDALAYCESGNRADYPPVSGGFSGLLMFHTGTWLANGGGEYAADAWLATRDQQIEIALRLWRVRGWQPWPGCRAKLGFN